MPGLPDVNDSLLVRTEFSDDPAWSELLRHIAQESDDGFRAHVLPVDDSTFAGADWTMLKGAVPANETGASVLFVADEHTLSTKEHPVLVVDLLDDHRPFRCAADHLWGVENNLNIGNMDWNEFADNAAADGVFRGF